MKYKSFVETPELLQLPVVDYLSPEMQEDANRVLREHRQKNPLCYVKPFGALGLLSFEDVDNVLRDPKNFSSDFQILPPPDGAKEIYFTSSLVRQDPPGHTRVRALVQKAMPSHLSSVDGLVRRLVRELVGKILERGDTFDFIDDFAEPLPLYVLAEILGVDASDRSRFKRWSDALASRASVHFLPPGIERDRRLAEMAQNYVEMDRFLRESIALRRREPAGDLISALVQASEAGDVLGEDEIVGLVQLLLMAGIETTIRHLALTMNALIHYHQIDLIAGSAVLAEKAVEEGLRFEGPLVSLLRLCMNETTIRGFKIPKGMLVSAVICSANHDETVHTNPEVFDLHRERNRHFAFGNGIHACVGAPIARATSSIAFEELTLAMDRIRPAGTAVRARGILRGFEKMPLRFERRTV